MRVSILCLAITNFLGVSLLQADDLASSISKELSPQYQKYYYEVYQFERNDAADGFVAVLSKEFDTYLLLIDSKGNVLKNDDLNSYRINKNLAGAQPYDSALPLGPDSVGKWVAIVTSNRAGLEGDYTLRHEGVSDLQKVNRDKVDLKQVAKAFGERGVLSDSERRRRAEEARAAKIEGLSEQLSLYSYRAKVRGQMNLAIKKNNNSYKKESKNIDEFSKREKAIRDALSDTNKLAESKELVQKLLNIELVSVQRHAKQASANAVTALSKRDAFTAALKALDLLDILEKKLETAEIRLLEAKTTAEVGAAQAQRGRLKKERATLSATIAEKLIDSSIVDLVSRFSTYWERSPSRNISHTDKKSGGSLRAGRSVVAVASKMASGARIKRRVVPIDPTVWLPSLLPWPPPDSSARAVISSEFFTEDLSGNHTLGNLNGALRKALVRAGYSELSYFGVPQGFAIVTRLEQTDGHGLPLSGEARWLAKIQHIKSFSIAGYIRALLTSPPGYFRVVTLVVSSKPFSSSGDRLRLKTLERWSREGFNVLPLEIQGASYTKDHRVTALVYEFEKIRKDDQPNVRIPGRLSVAQHLQNTPFQAHLM